MATSQPKISELAATVLKDDKELRNELKGLVQDLIRYQKRVMLVGSPTEKMALVRTILPQMLSAMGQAAQAEAEATEQAAYDRMRAALRGELPAGDVSATLRAVS